eukprot:TRINITY_DN902_c0_g2_i1.p1 TRINITY_DN902_c0_g2~~TRINITY_DN902_c0_g2_i1.p1  ORF type:complete len:525 (-),score=153.13 TRINITY_DN902_c0_g2_i1:119-1693(-)
MMKNTSLLVLFFLVIFINVNIIKCVDFYKFDDPVPSNNTSSHENESKDDDDEPELFTYAIIYGTLLTFLGGSLCAGTGIGGGAFYIPVYILILGLDPHVAVPLSKVTIFGVSIGGYLVNFSKRHPLTNRPLIDYNVALLMEPMTLIGSIIGVFLNVVFPAYLIIVFLIMLLSYSTYKTFRKGYRTYKLETKPPEEEDHTVVVSEDEIDDENYDIALQEIASEDLSNSLNEDNDENELFLNEMDDDNKDLNKINDDSDGENDNFERIDDENEPDIESLYESSIEADNIRQAILKKESKIPYIKILGLFFLWIGMFIIILLKGGTAPDSSIIGIVCGSWEFWFLVIISFPYLASFSGIFGAFLRYEYKKKLRVNYEFITGDIHWNLKNTVSLPILSILAGVAAGFLGIGGGMVKGPLMLSMNMLPQVAVVTSAFMIIFTSSSTTAQFIILGKLPISFGIWYFFVGLFAAVVGNLFVGWLVKKYKKQSYINFLLGFCIVLSAIVMTFTLIYGMIQGTESMHFESICD